MKSGAVAQFDAQAVMEVDATVHPKFRLEFAAPEDGGRRLVYLDRDDVSAVVVEDAGETLPARAATAAEAMISLPTAGEESDVLTVSLAGAPAP
jgi:hypothetical protein